MEPRTLVTLMDVNLGRQSRNTSIVAAFHSTGQSGNRLRKVEGTTKLLATRVRAKVKGLTAQRGVASNFVMPVIKSDTVGQCRLL